MCAIAAGSKRDTPQFTYMYQITHFYFFANISKLSFLSQIGTEIMIDFFTVSTETAQFPTVFTTLV